MFSSIRQLALILVCASAVTQLWAADAFETARLRRFNEAKFGMFIHWGPYSQASVEASWPIMTPRPGGISEAEYRKLATTFDPKLFDAQQIVRLAKEAGQQYIVFTTKHHDGFCMFDSAFTSYKITNTPYGKDVVAMLAKAAKDEGMPLGLYYSPPDMNHPAYRDTSKPSYTNFAGEPTRPEWPLYLDYMGLQLRELLTRYGDVFLIWFDGLQNQRKYDGYRVHQMIHELQPMALINDRIGLRGDFVTPEQRLPKGIPRKSSTVENVNPNDKGVLAGTPDPEDFQPWETCMTINNTWAYNKNDHNYKSTSDLVRALIDAASKGGNFLLNIGPMPDGTVQPEFQERLRGIGAWLKVNGDSIYGTTFGPLQDVPFGRTTAKGNTVYLHVYSLPPTTLEVAGLGKVRSVRALSGGQSLKFEQDGDKLTIQTAGLRADQYATVLVVER